MLAGEVAVVVLAVEDAMATPEVEEWATALVEVAAVTAVAVVEPLAAVTNDPDPEELTVVAPVIVKTVGSVDVVGALAAAVAVSVELGT